MCPPALYGCFTGCLGAAVARILGPVSALLVPLALGAVASSWRCDVTTTVIIVVVLATYLYGLRRSPVGRGSALAFFAGAAIWWISACAFIGVYADVLFWVRALQFVLALMVAPFFLALGKPVTVARGVVGEATIDRLLGARAMRILASPAVTSAGVIVTPWLIYLTAWYPTLLTSYSLDVATRVLLVACGFGYFYARLQVDPVPRRRAQGLSLLITLGETLGDGVLGVIMWQGPLIAAAYYNGLHRAWGPSIRTDQTIGAGVFWILGDIVGLPFLLVLFDRFRTDEAHRAVIVDAEQDEIEATAAEDGDGQTGLWWESHPELRERLR